MSLAKREEELNTLLTLGDERFLSQIKPAHFISASPSWELTYQKLINVVTRHCRGAKKLKREDMFDFLCEGDPPVLRNMTLEVFKKRYRTVDGLGEQPARQLAQMLFDRGYVAAALNRLQTHPNARESDPDIPFYNVVKRWLRYDEQHEKRTAASVTGYFQLWRHSTSIPGYVVQGLVRFRFSAPDYRTYAEVTQRFSDRSPDKPGMLKLATREETFRGYLLPFRSDNILLVVRGENAPGFRLSVFTDIAPMAVSGPRDPGVIDQVFSMTGCVLGGADSRGFFSPIYLERILDLKQVDPYRKSMNLYPEYEVPDKIRAILARIPPVTF